MSKITKKDITILTIITINLIITLILVFTVYFNSRQLFEINQLTIDTKSVLNSQIKYQNNPTDENLQEFKTFHEQYIDKYNQ